MPRDKRSIDSSHPTTGVICQSAVAGCLY